jgi:hypothetical protein
MHKLVAVALLLLCTLAIVPTSGLARVAPPIVAPKEEPPNPILQKLQTARFDRKASTILKARVEVAKPAPVVKDDDPKKNKKKLDKDDLFLKKIGLDVALGRWDDLKAELMKQPEKDRKTIYQAILRGLSAPPRFNMPTMDPESPNYDMEMMMVQQLPGGVAAMLGERNVFSADDVLGILRTSPEPHTRESLLSVSSIIRQCLEAGNVVEALVARLKNEANTTKIIKSRDAARLLIDAGHPEVVGELLPSLEEANKAKDLEVLNLLARHYLGLYERESKLALLEKAWSSTQAILALPLNEKPAKDDTPDEHAEALARAVELAPRLEVKLGQKWLDESFSKEPLRGLTILANIGTLSSQSLMRQMRNSEPRLKTLRLLKNAVEALLRVAPTGGAQWNDTLNVLAAVWLREAEVTQRYAENSGAARIRRDRFGNIYYWEEMMMSSRRNPYQPTAISVLDMLEVRPTKAWLALLKDDLRPKISILLAQLHLKVEEEAEAFTYIEQIAATHKQQAKDLAKEFLRVWTSNHDLNANKRNTNPYMYMFGFDRRSDGIPLTRSKQERNLTDLSQWVTRLRKLPIGDLDEDLLAKAFTACHSSAEVYRAEAIEKVFGPMGSLKPKVLSGLAQQMRENLAGIWRKPEEQKDKGTNRKMQDIQAEVKRGYKVALDTVEKSMQKMPKEYALVQARAAILHDEINFLAELSKTTSFSAKRQEAFKEFARAAQLYADVVGTLQEDDQTNGVYEQWLYASLGASDLGQISEEKVPDLRQPALIKAAIEAQPGELAEKHRAKFANQLFSRLSSVKPQVKYRYLKAGFEIVGDHKQAFEAKKVYEYYKDLVTEIKLETSVDGATTVGHDKPFGVFVNLRHTRDIERESGGFGRYLQNQNTSTMFSWNYGRPTADYRDRFQTVVNEACKEHFEVVSVTFETDKVHSRATDEYGWRVTPYAYLLLKARGPQVDKLPPLRMDLDFLDTSGFVVLPIESPTVPIDARPKQPQSRPVKKMEVTQILDERQAKEGKLLLEIKVTGTGLIPELNEILKVEPTEFDVTKTDDQGVSVSRFNQESENISVISERIWMISLAAKPGIVPKTFEFPKLATDDAKSIYQRYDDADLVSVSDVVELERNYGKASWTPWLVGGGGVLVLLLGGVVLWRTMGKKVETPSRWQLPSPMTPFTVIALFEKIRDEAQLDENRKADLNKTIREIEQHWFAASAGQREKPDLETMAKTWLAQVK